MGLLSEFAGIGGGSIGRASVDLVLNTTAYNAQLAEAEGKTKASAGGLSKAFSDVRNALGPVGIAAVAASAIAVIGIGQAIHATQEWAAEVRTLQRVTGDSAENTSRLAAAGELLNLSTDKLNTGFGILDKNIINNSANFAKYNVVTKDAAGNTLPFLDILGNLSDKFQTLQAGPEQAAFAMNVFGRSGKELIPVLSRGREGLQELYDSAQKAGLVMSQDALDASKNLSIAQRELGHAFKGAAVAIGTAFIPLLTPIVHAFTQLVEIATRVVTTVIHVGQAIGKALAPYITPVVQAFQDLGRALGDAFSQVGEALQPILPYLKEFGALLGGLAIAGLIAALEVLAFVIETTAKEVQALTEWLGPLLTQAINAAVNGINVFIGLLNKVIDISNLVLRTHFEHIDALQQISSASTEAGNASEDYATRLANEARALKEATRAEQAHRLAQLQAADGLLGLVSSLQQTQQDQADLNRLQREGKRGTQDYRDAVVQATTDQLAFREAVRQYVADNPNRSLAQTKNILKEMAAQAGISGREFQSALGNALNSVGGNVDNLRHKWAQFRQEASTPVTPIVNTALAQANIDRLRNTLARLS